MELTHLWLGFVLLTGPYDLNRARLELKSRAEPRLRLSVAKSSGALTIRIHTSLLYVLPSVSVRREGASLFTLSKTAPSQRVTGACCMCIRSYIACLIHIKIVAQLLYTQYMRMHKQFARMCIHRLRMHTDKHTCAHEKGTHPRTDTQTHTQTHTHAHTHTHTRSYTHSLTHKHTHTHAHIHILYTYT